MSQVPYARDRLNVIADALDEGRIPPDQAAQRIRGLMPLLVRKAPNERVTGKTVPFTPELAEEIRIFKRTEGAGMNQAEIAAHFNVNPGRVSEALGGD